MFIKPGIIDSMTQKMDITPYMERAREALEQAHKNVDLGYYGIAITRGYYAMFYAASGLLASKGITRSKHSGVHAAFRQYFVKPGLIEAEFAKSLSYAFDSRLDSDYDLFFTAEKEQAEVILRAANRFVKRVAEYLTGEKWL